MSDVNFLNAYNEVILDNFNAVLKQNLMFQTQLKFVEEKLKEIPELEKQVASIKEDRDSKLKELIELGNEKNTIQNQLDGIRGELNSKNSILENAVQSDNDKHRLQNALNTQAKQLEALNGRIQAFEDKSKEQDEYIKQLEEMLPNSKRKKLGLEVVEEQKSEAVKEVKKEEVKVLDNVTPLKVESSGGTF
jgi:chromosome segregation ATPase